MCGEVVGVDDVVDVEEALFSQGPIGDDLGLSLIRHTTGETPGRERARAVDLLAQA